ncbi:GNAT family N-acetyltransferase [Pleurocapsales cyanobacterium LEGE 06147]|nr:GNAT family N-acetyltransferase [Pleurocapsales cyanobacterium LEGE 06147]
MKLEIITERMQLSPVTEADTDELHQLWTQPEIRKYLWDDRIIEASQTQQIVTQSISAFSDREYGLWLARLLNTKPLIGFCGYWPFFEPPQIQLIYGLSPQYWGRGLATEMARAAIDYGFQEWGFKVICASTDVPNKASIAVIKRLGMTYQKQEEINGKETIFYQLNRN